MASTLYKKRLKIWEAHIRFAEVVRCYLCAQVIEKFEDATLDHVHPRSQGGTNAYRNLRIACIPCNLRKGHMSLAEYWQTQQAERRRAKQRRRRARRRERLKNGPSVTLATVFESAQKSC